MINVDENNSCPFEEIDLESASVHNELHNSSSAVSENHLERQSAETNVGGRGTNRSQNESIHPPADGALDSEFKGRIGTITTPRDRFREWTDTHVTESMRFAMRVTFALSLAYLFVLCFSAQPGEGFPEATWVYITVGIVSWQAQPDVGSVVSKAYQRVIGTILGGLLGLLIGALSLLIPDHGSPNQAAFLGVCGVVVTFVFVYYANKWGFRSHYGAILGSLTLQIVMLSFFDTNPMNGLRVAIFRIVNIILGGVLSSIACLIVFPVSTKSLLESQVLDLMKLTGKAAKEVLLAAGSEKLPSIQMILHDAEVEDPAHASYTKGVGLLNSLRGLKPLLDFDPAFASMTKTDRQKWTELWRMKLATILRIQATVIFLDTILRERLIGDDVLNAELLQRVGEHIETIMNRAEPLEKRNRIALQLLQDDLPAIQNELAQIRSSSNTLLDDHKISSEEMMKTLATFDEDFSSIQNVVDKQTDSFYRISEFLILRCVRLHHL